MGEAKAKRRMTLYKQIILYFIKVICFTMVTALTLMLASYYIYHSFAGFQSPRLNNDNIVEVMEYVNEHSGDIMKGEGLEELKSVIDSNHLDCYIKDARNRILYKSNTKYTASGSEGYFARLVREMADNTFNSSAAEIPLFDRETGKVSRVLVLTQNNSTFMVLFILVDICIPLICFIIYIIVFSKSLGRDIKGPLDELMAAVDNIKEQNLEFHLDSRCNNEIGDLMTAFEDMRLHLKDSLIRQWQLEQDRREMVAAITHDLRSPLAIIQGHLEGLQEGVMKDKDKLKVYLDIICRNTLRAKLLIDDMNSLVEVDNPGFNLQLKEENIIEFLNNKIEEIKILASDKQITIVADISDCRNMDQPVMIDSRRLAQVIDNIISNSIYFTPAQGRIHLKARIESNAAYFSVCDSGPGFTEKNLGNLFKKFYKGDPSRSKEKVIPDLDSILPRQLLNGLTAPSKHLIWRTAGLAWNSVLNIKNNGGVTWEEKKKKLRLR